MVAPVQALDVTGCHEDSELEQQKQNKPAGPSRTVNRIIVSPAPPLIVTSNLAELVAGRLAGCLTR